tara:strand:- start:260 stop:361 length:102 start_codon:yes stop_codon:yes gene_type:complete
MVKNNNNKIAVLLIPEDLGDNLLRTKAVSLKLE